MSALINDETASCQRRAFQCFVDNLFHKKGSAEAGLKRNRRIAFWEGTTSIDLQQGREVENRHGRWRIIITFTKHR